MNVEGERTTALHEWKEAKLKTTYIYLNRPNLPDLPEEDLLEIDRAGYTVDLSKLVVEHQPAFRPAADRPELQRLIRRIAIGDGIVAMRLSCLGNSVRDVLSTIEACRERGAEVRCLETGRPDLARQPETGPTMALRAAARLDLLVRQTRSEDSIDRARTGGTAPGRPPTFSTREQVNIMRKLARGASISEVARACGTSRQTVLRIRAKHSE